VANVETTAVEARPSSDLPFHVLFIGDWSGRSSGKSSAATEELKTYLPRFVDSDNLDDLIAQLGVRLNLPLTGREDQSIELRFEQLDDFHPDSLVQRLDIFDSLLRLRNRLKNSKTFADAVREIRASEATSDKAKNESGSVEKDLSRNQAAADNLLDQILSASNQSTSPTQLSQPAAEVSEEITRLAKAVVTPHIVPDIENQDQFLALVDDRMGGILKTILHNPAFQSLESAWRALDFVVRRLETGSDLKLYLFDMSFDEFRSDLLSQTDYRATALYKVLVEDTVGTPGGPPWGVVAANYTFDFSTDDQSLIEPVSKIAHECGAPFIAGVTPHLLGCASLVATPDPDDWNDSVASGTRSWWDEVTTRHAAGYVGLVLPRFLLRLPYGKDTDPTEQFDFEEIGEPHSFAHEDYLWANASFVVAYLLAKGFSEDSWSFRPSEYLEIGDLPLHVYERDGESEIKPCGEVLLTVKAANAIIDVGLIPILSMKNSDVIRLGMMQSIACSPLRGRWIKN
ncbi:MAG: hypothetical protein C5B55_05810, partial [Blastocatellia bacterium]